MASQGIKGPPYTLIHGNTKQVANMYKEAMSKPLDLSHAIVPVVLPHVHAWSSIHGKNFLQWQGTRAQLVVTEPELCKELEIFNNKDGAHPKPTSLVPKILLGNGLPLLEGEKWAKSRKLANHAFHGESLKSMIPQMIASAETMLGRWKNHVGQEIEVFQEFRLLTAEVISRTAFGSSYLQGQHIFEMLMKLSPLLVNFDLKLKLPGIRREEKAMSGEEETFGSDFLGLQLKAYHDTNDNQRISIDDIVDECKSFYFAGQETVNTLLSWTVFLLALHNDWQEEARKEVLQLFGKQTPNPNDLSKLKTMSMIINESLRLYSPILYVTRSIERTVRLGKLIVPTGVELIIPFLAIHHDLQFWGQDAHLFKPDRFSEGVAKQLTTTRRHSYHLEWDLGIM
ncbi:putative cytochrome P450 [Rosa chinensis]|uniref:Putative cytochrome P450 n=1 Tax=Rosa chinensis TaxID=74649 RepID=A0A2P6QXY7_ROSCH|nr:putative cytochrome P450 [Rosa chinensis]